MGKKLKWTLIIALGVMAVVVIGGYIFIVSYDLNSLKPQIAKAAKNATGRDLRIGGDIKLALGLTPSLLLSDIAFQNAAWGSREDLVRLKQFEIKVELLPLLKRMITIKRFILTEPDILIETDKKGRSNLAFEVAAAQKPSGQDDAQQEPAPETDPAEKDSGKGLQLPALTLNQVEIHDGLLTIKDHRTQKTTRVGLKQLLATTIGTATGTATGLDQPLEIKAESSFNGQPIGVSGTLGAVTAAMDPTQSWPLKLDINAFGVRVGLDGAILNLMGQQGIDVGFNLQADDFTQLAKALKTQLPPLTPLKVTGRLKDKGPKTYHLAKFKATYGPSDIGGDVSINLAGKRPAINATLSSQKTDLRPLSGGKPSQKTGSGQATKTKSGAKRTGKVFPNDPLPLDGLKAVDATIKLTAGQLILPQLAIGKLSTDLALKNGLLTIKPVKAKIGGGNLSAYVRLQPKGKSASLAANVKLNGLDLGGMLAELGITKLLRGHLNADIKLNGWGGSVAKLMAGLNGHASVIMKEGRIHNKLLDILGGDMAAGFLRLLNPLAAKKEFTTVNCFVARFDMKKGLADTTALVFDTDLVGVIGEGVINLRTEGLKMSLKPQPKEGLGTKTLGISLSLTELAKPFKLGGSLARPALAIDKSKAALSLGKTIGGIALLGPAGVATALIGGKSGNQSPCPAAIQAAKTGKKLKTVAAKSAGKSKSGGKKSSAAKNPLKGVENTLKGLFGN